MARVGRFLLVGGSAALLNLLLLWFLTSVCGGWYLGAAVVSYLLCISYNFALQRAWAFDGRCGSVLNQAPLFAATNLLGLALNTCILYLLVQNLGVWYLAAQAMTSLAIAAFSFLAYRWIFAGGRKGQRAA
ncbi:MAG: GtrA family protein [Alphaproteobacteria bacterium]